MKARCQRFGSLMAIGFGAILLLASCTTVPVTGRRQLNVVSAGQETQLGLTSFDQLKKETPINHDPALNAMLQRVGKRVAEVAGKDRSEEHTSELQSRL